MAQEMKVNIMSVELAIQRELAYRNKVASLSPESSFTNFSPLEVPCPTRPPNANMGSQSHPISIGSMSAPHEFSPSANQNTLSMYGAAPIPSQWPALSVASAFPWTEGTGVGQLLPYPRQQPQSSCFNDSAIIFCKVCKVNCSGQVSYKQHLRGHKHRAKLQLHQMMNASGQKKQCNLCEIWCTDENALRLHLNGQKHKAKLQEIEQGKKPSQMRWCNLCRVPCTNEDAYRLHLQGKNHLNNLRAMEAKKKAV